MEILHNLIFSDEIKKNIFENKNISNILSKLPKEKVYLFGGAVRDPIVNLIYDKNISIRDYDFFIDDLEEKFNLTELYSDFPSVNFSKFNNPKLIFDSFEVDLVPFSKVETISKLKLEINLENILRCCDLTTSSICYSLGDENIYSYNALDYIRLKKIGVLTANIFPIATIVRLIVHSEKLGFSIDEHSKHFIKTVYSPKIDKEIESYINYKKYNFYSDKIFKKLKE